MYSFCSLEPQRGPPRVRYPIQPAELWPGMPRLSDEVGPAPLVLRPLSEQSVPNYEVEQNRGPPTRPPLAWVLIRAKRSTREQMNQERASETCKASCDEASRAPR